MANNAAIAVPDGESTPVTHTFSPIRINPKTGKAEYDNRAQTYANGREALSIGMVSGSKVRTIDVVVKIPKVVTETINGVAVPKVVSYATHKITSIVPLDWSDQERKNARVVGNGIGNHATVAAMIEAGEFVW